MCFIAQEQPFADLRITSGILSSTALWICWSGRMIISPCSLSALSLSLSLHWKVLPQPSINPVKIPGFFSAPWDLGFRAWLDFLCLPSIWLILLCVTLGLFPPAVLRIWRISQGLVSGCVTGCLCPVKPDTPGTQDGRAVPGFMSRPRWNNFQRKTGGYLLSGLLRSFPENFLNLMA